MQVRLLFEGGAVKRLVMRWLAGLAVAAAVAVVPVVAWGQDDKAEADKANAASPAEDHGKAEDVHGKADDHAAGNHAAGGHGAHDDTDLSHANATAELSNPAEMRFDLAIYTAVVFFLLLAILYKFGWGPISRGLEHREKSIADKIEQATRAAEQATEQLKQYEAKLAAAADEARAIVAQAHKDGEATREKIVAEANASAQRERDRAVADINAAKNEALRAIAKQSVDTAIKLAGDIVNREVKPAEHERLINEALSGFSKLN